MNEYTITYRVGLTKRHKMRKVKVSAASAQGAVDIFDANHPDWYFYTVS
jgi:hypothetical protein